MCRAVPRRTVQHGKVNRAGTTRLAFTHFILSYRAKLYHAGPVQSCSVNVVLAGAGQYGGNLAIISHATSKVHIIVKK